MSTIKANTLLHSNGSTTTPPSIPALDTRMARVWVHYDGDTAGIDDDYNVSSITDNATGDFTVNFTNALANANYAESIQASGRTSVFCARGYGTKTTSARPIRTVTTAGTATDGNEISYIVFSN